MKKTHWLALLLALAMAVSCVSACSGAPATQTAGAGSEAVSTAAEAPGTESEAVSTAAETPGTGAAQQPPAIIAAASKVPTGAPADDELLEALCAFSEDLFRRVIAEGDADKTNAVFSPLCAYFVLSMTANGAGGQTLEEMDRVLGLKTDTRNEYLYAMLKTLAAADRPVLSVANAFWGNADAFRVAQDFQKVAQAYYLAEAGSLPFSDPATTGKINDWVSRKTDGMIPKMLEDGDLDGAVMLLMSTVLFTGIWEQKYEESQILHQPFLRADGTQTEGRFLSSTESGYFEIPGAKGFSKKYEDGSRFIAVLPDSPEGTAPESPDRLVFSLDLQALIRTATEANGMCRALLPCFEYGTDAELNGALAGMGMPTAFTGDADLRALGEDGRGLCISRVWQKAKIRLDEHGTKAAAATSVTIKRTSVTIPKTVILDRPFFYVITDPDGLPLFLGIVRDPAAKP